MLRIEEIVGCMDDEFRYALDAFDDAELARLKADKAALRRLRPVGVSHAEAIDMIEAILARRARARQAPPPKPKRKRTPRPKKVTPAAALAASAPPCLPAPITAPLLPPPGPALPAIRLPAPPQETPAIELPAPAAPPALEKASNARLLLAMGGLLLLGVAFLAV